MGSLRGSAGKEPACQCRRHKRCGFHLWVGKIPWRRKWRPTPVFLPGTSRGRRSLEASSPWGRRESDTTELAQKAAKNDKLRNPRFSYSSSSSEWTTQMFQSWKEPRALRTGSALPRRAVRLRPQFKPGLGGRRRARLHLRPRSSAAPPTPSTRVLGGCSLTQQRLNPPATLENRARPPNKE